MDNKKEVQLPILHSHGSGEFERSQFRKIGQNVIIEGGVLVFHPENIEIGNHVYIGHNSIIKGYYKARMVIGDGTWIGQQCFIHSAGDLIIGNNVGLGPGTKIITSFHIEEDLSKPLRYGKIVFSPVVIEDDVHIGLGTIILPGVTIAKGTQVGAGAVVTKNFPEYAVIAGAPARLLRIRGT